MTDAPELSAFERLANLYDGLCTIIARTYADPFDKAAMTLRLQGLRLLAPYCAPLIRQARKEIEAYNHLGRSLATIKLDHIAADLRQAVPWWRRPFYP